jgi:hypothetical protein
MPGSHLFNLGLFQKKFGGNNKIAGVSINLGSTKGRGSTTRMFNYCTQHSANPSGCINQFINVAPATPPPPTPTILVYSTSQGSSFVWSGVTFTLDTSLPNFSYTSTTTSIPATQLTQARTVLTGVTIGNSVLTIGANAFNGCTNLTSVTFTPTSTLASIGQNAFQNCDGLTSIIIPDSVTSIGTLAFQSCNNLTSVTLPTNPSFTSIATSTFATCIKLTSVSIPNSVTSIGDFAFTTCSMLTSVTIGNSVTSIGDQAFYLCTSLTSVIIPDSVTSISSNAFQSSGLATVTIANLQLAGIPSPATGVSFFGKTGVTTQLP